jgi:hypothetical protein
MPQMKHRRIVDVVWRRPLAVRVVECSKQFRKFLRRKARLAKDGPERAGFQIASAMHRNDHSSRRIARIDHYVMTACYAIHHETGSLEDL